MMPRFLVSLKIQKMRKGTTVHINFAELDRVSKSICNTIIEITQNKNINYRERKKVDIGSD